MVNRVMGLIAVALIVSGIAITPATGHTVTASSLNVRSGPGYGYSVIGTLSHGTVVNTVATSGAWTKINSPKTGWVYSAYLANTSHTGGTSTSNLGTVSRVGFVNLPSSGYGWVSNVASYRRWGKPRMIVGLETMGRRWKDGYPGSSGHILRYSDISLMNGGYFSPHVSHRLGVDVDVSPITTSGSAGYTYVGAWSYSTYYTQKYVHLIRSTWSVQYIFHNNSRISGVSYWPGHANHLHIRIY